MQPFRKKNTQLPDRFFFKKTSVKWLLYESTNFMSIYFQNHHYYNRAIFTINVYVIETYINHIYKLCCMNIYTKNTQLTINTLKGENNRIPE